MRRTQGARMRSRGVALVDELRFGLAGVVLGPLLASARASKSQGPT